jgi:HEPN domain-containing protein
MKEPLDLSYGLMIKAAHDLQAAEIGVANEAPLDTVAFHLQQCAEKLIKAFLNWKQVQYPKTHALGALLDLATPHETALEPFRERLLDMSSYAVEMRYDDEL